VEDATLSELADITMEMLDRQRLPAGTILLYGSASHLYHSGTTLYAMDWCCLNDQMSKRYSDIRIVPLPPMLREDSPGNLGRQLIELSTWIKRVYFQNITGIMTVWDKLISLFCNTEEAGLDLGYNETYTVALPSSLAADAPLIAAKLRTSSSHTTTSALDTVATNELIRPFSTC
jgi:hypothetical protein